MYIKHADYNLSLKDLNTFAVNVTAKKIIFVSTISLLINIWHKCKTSKVPFIILGEGSNILFLENYLGIVVINRIKGINITEKNNFWYLHVNSGEIWHDLVQYTLKIGLFGLENLAYIPGCVGSAAIQNIGAYGLEIKNVCNYVDIISLNNASIQRINLQQCNFSYRNSIFQTKYNYGYAVLSVGIKLSKIWKPIIFHSFFKNINLIQINPYKIFNTIYNIRKKKYLILRK
ncbi:UDP-N-acetylmuramate dehydrogenase [Buchnera aphidicola]|uniref:UDP-N-acetylmuramate dehydrogenase n=1 Tax=Buchnera aphidicola TaxID=9 RepID=UPI003BEEB87D